MGVYQLCITPGNQTVYKVYLPYRRRPLWFLLGPLVDFLEEADEDLSLHPSLPLVHRVDEASDTLVRFCLVLLEAFRQRDGRLRIDLLDSRLGCRVFLAVIVLSSSAESRSQCDKAYVQDLPLFGSRKFESGIDVPRALVVLPSEHSACLSFAVKAHEDICPDLADVLRQTVAIKVVVLNLEVLAHGDEDV